MEEERQLTLEEMLALAEKVENWREEERSIYISGSLGDLNLRMGWTLSGLSLKDQVTDYNIIIYYKKLIEIRKCSISEKKNFGRNVKQIYSSAKEKARENQQKEKEDALKYARGLLEK